MEDDFEESTSEGPDLHRYAQLARRRYLHFLLPLFFGWLAVWGASWLMAPRYQSSTLILVEQPTMPKDYVTPNVNDNLQDRLQSISQQILSRTRLLHIIDQFNLYGSEHAKRSPDQKVELMRKDIAIDLVRDVHNQITAFNVSYASRNPHTAQDVTSELTNLFINENLEVRQQQSEDTTQFLEGQLETARKILSDQEDRIRQFKGQHVGEMPTQLASNLQILTGLQAQLQNEADALNAARQQHVYLQTMADQSDAIQESTKPTTGSSSSLQGVDDQLEKLKTQLADMSSRYTSNHPDVRKLKEQIAQTEKLKDRLQKESSQNDAGGQKSSLTHKPSGPIQGQLKANQVEIANRERSLAELKAKVDEYQGRLNQEPVREQQLSDLTRGYDQSKANYDDLLKKKNESKMATSMELLQQGERFRIVDPPSYPQKPESPNRLKLCGIGIAVGLVLGLIVAGTFEKLDDRLHDVKEIKKMLPMEVIGEIPAIMNESDLQNAKRQAWMGWATAAIVIVTIMAGSAVSYLRG